LDFGISDFVLGVLKGIAMHIIGIIAALVVLGILE
jgi:hypothetical protein